MLVNKRSFLPCEFADIMELFAQITDGLRRKTLTLNSLLEEMVFEASGDNLAYVDNRREAYQKYGYDLWNDLDKGSLKSQGFANRLLYSKSEQFPDFVFKAVNYKSKLVCGSLLELKDSRGGNIASFNSTLPTKYKSLEEVDVINGTKLISRIATIKDGELAKAKTYYTYQRRVFYLVRTHRDDKKVKLSLVDASFFETVPKEHLIYRMFLNVLHAHLERKEIKIPPETIKQVEEVFSHVTDQSIIAASQLINGASVRPRLRIMAEAHPEGNPHSTHYPEISEGSFNLIIQATPSTKELANKLSSEISGIKAFSIRHKRNGEHIVFQSHRA